jgi:hypothetical protein
MASMGKRKKVLGVERKFKVVGERENVGKKESRPVLRIWSGKFYDPNDF